MLPVATVALRTPTLCQYKLAPETDAVLHGRLVPPLTAAQKFKADAEDMRQLQAVRTAVPAYPRYFDAPDWTTEVVRKR